MKKVLVVLLVLALMFCFAACGGEVDKDVDFEAIYDAVVDNAGDEVVLFAEEDQSLIEDFYRGFGELEGVEDSAFWFHPVTGAGCELAIIKVTDKKYVDAAKTCFQGRIDLGSADSFYPDTARDWKNGSKILTYGKYVIMVCLPNGLEVPEKEIEALFK